MRSQNLIFTLYGDFLRDRTDEVWVGTFINLLEPLGMTDQAVRSTLSRMLRNGWFDTRREGRHSYYALTPRSERLLDEGKDASRAAYLARCLADDMALMVADRAVQVLGGHGYIRDYPVVNQVRNRVFAGREPASTMVEVTKFVHPLARIEIEAVAIRAR